MGDVPRSVSLTISERAKLGPTCGGKGGTKMLHWRHTLMLGAVALLVAVAAIGGGFHWGSAFRAF